MPHFETFKKALVPLAQEPHITVQKRGTVTLNAAAYAALGSPRAVELLFDREARILGMRSVDTGVPHAVAVRAGNRSGKGPYVISAMAFLKYYGVDTCVARRWAARVEHKVLCVDVDAPARIVSKTSS